MSKTLIRLAPVALIAGMVLAGGCSSCQQSAEVPEPVSKQGHLPQPPEAAVTPGATVEIPPACAVVASASTEEGPAPLEVKFTAEGMCTDATGGFTWDFGDGSPPSRDQNPVHTYTAPGTYTARVSLEDPEHDTKDTDELPMSVTAPQP